MPSLNLNPKTVSSSKRKIKQQTYFPSPKGESLEMSPKVVPKSIVIIEETPPETVETTSATNRQTNNKKRTLNNSDQQSESSSMDSSSPQIPGAKRQKPNKWTKEEDETLLALKSRASFKGRYCWNHIANELNKQHGGNKTAAQACKISFYI
jgi:hypothetical protein